MIPGIPEAVLSVDEEDIEEERWIDDLDLDLDHIFKVATLLELSGKG